MDGAEYRIEPNAKGKMLSGYAARYAVLSEDLGGYREIIQPGFFDDALKRADDIYALLNHNDIYILGERNAGTLRLLSDLKGLRFEIDLPETRTVNDLVVSPVERKELKGTSFGFNAKSLDIGYTWTEDPDTGAEIRTLLPNGARRIYDVSPVTFPAYVGNEIALRSLAEWKENRSIPAQESSIMLGNNIEKEILKFRKLKLRRS
jgi:hypothetical protein